MNTDKISFWGMPVERQPLIAELCDSAQVLTHPMMRVHLGQTPQNWGSVGRLSVSLCRRGAQIEMIFERCQRRGANSRPICMLKLIGTEGQWPRSPLSTSKVTLDNAVVSDSRKSIAGLRQDERVVVRYVRFYMAQLDAQKAKHLAVARRAVRA